MLNDLLGAQECDLDGEGLKRLANDLGMASQHLRSAWKTMKHNGMEETAKELADVVLDVETAAEQVNAALVANVRVNSAAEGSPATERSEG